MIYFRYMIVAQDSTIMAPDIIEDWIEAVTYIENRTGYMDHGEVRRRVAQRFFFWIICFIVASLAFQILLYGSDLRPSLIGNISGTSGAVILAIAPLKKDINDIHYLSAAPSGTEKDRMPRPVIRNLNRITDRTTGLGLVALAFLIQIFI